MSIETKNGEAVILSFSAYRVRQENNEIILFDEKGAEAVQIKLSDGTTHRIL
jgi:hypothetical protein